MTSLTPQYRSVEATAGRARVPPLVIAMRPRQWTKNLLLLAGLVFAGKAADTGSWLDALGGFVAFAALSSAAYLVNDVRDAAHDRLHPTKRLRPIARGDLSVRTARFSAVLLTAIAFSVGALLGTSFVVLLSAFATLQLAYTFALKRAPVIDVLAIAGAFALRAAAGAAAVHVRTSPWLLICTVLLALFLAFAKRRGELVLVSSGQTSGRPVLALYTLPFLEALLWLAAAATVSVYTLYTLAARDQSELVATAPFVAFGVARYLYLVHRDDLGEEPERVLLQDVPILVSVALWALTALWILTLS